MTYVVSPEAGERPVDMMSNEYRLGVGTIRDAFEKGDFLLPVDIVNAEGSEGFNKVLDFWSGIANELAVKFKHNIEPMADNWMDLSGEISKEVDRFRSSPGKKDAVPDKSRFEPRLKRELAPN